MKKMRNIALVVIVFLYIASIQGMFPRVRQGVQQKSPVGARKISRKITPTTTNITKRRTPAGQSTSASWAASTMVSLKAQVARFLQEQYARLWKKEPAIVVPRELSVPVVQQVKRPKAISQARKPEARIESEEILAKLKEPNPWNYSEGSMQSVYDAIKSPLAQQIKSFLEKNNGDDIENIVFYLIHVDEGFEILREMSTENSSFAVKLLPLIEKNFDQIDDDHFIKSIILKMPHDQLVVQTDSLKEKFLKKISLFFILNI